MGAKPVSQRRAGAGLSFGEESEPPKKGLRKVCRRARSRGLRVSFFLYLRYERTKGREYGEDRQEENAGRKERNENPRKNASKQEKVFLLVTSPFSYPHHPSSPEILCTCISFFLSPFSVSLLVDGRSFLTCSGPPSEHHAAYLALVKATDDCFSGLETAAMVRLAASVKKAVLLCSVEGGAGVSGTALSDQPHITFHIIQRDSMAPIKDTSLRL